MTLSFLLENYHEIDSITFKGITYALFEAREYNPYIKRLVVNVNGLEFTQVDKRPFTDCVYCPKCHQWEGLKLYAWRCMVVRFHPTHYPKKGNKT